MRLTESKKGTPGRRPVIAFFDYPDAFEEFYPDYGIDQRTFATRWAETGNHAFINVLQQDIGDVVWYTFSIKPELETAHHETVGCTVKFFRTSWLHRMLWWLFYMAPFAWIWEGAYPAYAVVASYVSLPSWSFLRAIRRDPPDFIFVQDYATGRFDTLLLLAKLLGAPLIAYHSGSLPDEYVGKLAKRWTIPRADYLVVSSRKEAQMLAERYRVPQEKLKVILTPLDMNTYRPMSRAEACRRAGLDPTRHYLLFVGRLDDPVKRVSTLIEAFVLLADDHPDVDFLIAGGGPDEDELRQMAEETLPSRVRFLGWVTPEQKPPLYNAAECLLLASRSEGFPTVVGEAMACGTPVLASNVGGINELVVGGQTGWLFEPGDDSHLAQLLGEVLDSPERLAAMRSQARKVAEDRLSRRAVARALSECFCLPESLAADSLHEKVGS
jgi:glycosyltransferase involved in cell wall biosynthesis